MIEKIRQNRNSYTVILLLAAVIILLADYKMNNGQPTYVQLIVSATTFALIGFMISIGEPRYPRDRWVENPPSIPPELIVNEDESTTNMSVPSRPISTGRGDFSYLGEMEADARAVEDYMKNGPPCPKPLDNVKFIIPKSKFHTMKTPLKETPEPAVALLHLVPKVHRSMYNDIHSFCTSSPKTYDEVEINLKKFGRQYNIKEWTTADGKQTDGKSYFIEMIIGDGHPLVRVPSKGFFAFKVDAELEVVPESEPTTELESIPGEEHETATDADGPVDESLNSSDADETDDSTTETSDSNHEITDDTSATTEEPVDTSETPVSETTSTEIPVSETTTPAVEPTPVPEPAPEPERKKSSWGD